MKKVHVKTGDTVIIMSGDDKGKTGKVLQVSPKEGKIIVEKINMIKKHVKARKADDPSGIITTEGAFYASKAQIYCSNCKKPTRVAHNRTEDGKCERICAKCKEKI